MIFSPSGWMSVGRGFPPEGQFFSCAWSVFVDVFCIIQFKPMNVVKPKKNVLSTAYLRILHTIWRELVQLFSTIPWKRCLSLGLTDVVVDSRAALESLLPGTLAVTLDDTDEMYVL